MTSMENISRTDPEETLDHQVHRTEESKQHQGCNQGSGPEQGSNHRIDQLEDGLCPTNSVSTIVIIDKL